MSQPDPFCLVRSDDGLTVATNGRARLICLDADGAVKLRRGVCGLMSGPASERVLPLLNQLAGELLQHREMDPTELSARLHALQLLCKPPSPQHLEWAYAELAGVRVYTDGQDVIVTRQDLRI